MKHIADYELTTKILISMIIGALLGLVINFYGWNTKDGFVDVYIVNGVFYIIGELFIILLKILVVPLVFFSLISGVISIENIVRLGRIGFKSLMLYLFTTFMAVVTAMTLVIFISPGHNIIKTFEKDYTKEASITVKSVLQGIPDNIFEAFASGNMLIIILFSIFFATAYLSLGKRNVGLDRAIETINQIVMKMVHMITMVAPIAVFTLIARPIADQGMKYIDNLSGYILVVFLALFIHFFVTLMLLFKITTGLSPKVFLSKMRETQLFAFSTASSNATMPSTLQTLTEKIGVKNSIASFTVPFGATVNMDGTAIMQSVATVFIANAYNVPLDIYDYLLIVGMSILASIGTAGVPGVGLIMLSMVFLKLGLPIEGIAILLSVDRLLDMLRTVVNVTGDAVVTCIIAKQEGELDENIFYNFRAGMSNDNLTEDETKKVLEEMLKSAKYEVEIDEDGKQGMIRLKNNK